MDVEVELSRCQTRDRDGTRPGAILRHGDSEHGTTLSMGATTTTSNGDNDEMHSDGEQRMGRGEVECVGGDALSTLHRYLKACQVGDLQSVDRLVELGVWQYHSPPRRSRRHRKTPRTSGVLVSGILRGRGPRPLCSAEPVPPFRFCGQRVVIVSATPSVSPPQLHTLPRAMPHPYMHSFLQLRRRTQALRSSGPARALRVHEDLGRGRRGEGVLFLRADDLETERALARE